VLVIGAGPVALLWLLALKATGTSQVVVAGRRASKLTAAQALGADEVMGEGDDVLDRVRSRTGGRGADVVIECTGNARGVAESARLCASWRHGRALRWLSAGTTMTLDTYRMHYDGVRVASPFHFRPRDVAEAFRLLGRRDLGWDKLITSRAGLDDVPAVFERLGDGHEIKCAIVPDAAGG
jgi:L-iditol 2-dehydrogenase